MSSSETPGNLSANTQNNAISATAFSEEDELVEKETRERFKRMCEGYFDTISKKLVREHLVCTPICLCSMVPQFKTCILQKLQEQDRRNHEAYIRSGEIFEDRQQAYEKMTKSYEKMLSSCQV